MSFNIQDIINNDVHNGFTWHPTSNNYKLLLVLISVLNNNYFNLKDETVGLIERLAAGNDTGNTYIALDRLGEYYGVRRSGLNNRDYARLILALSPRAITRSIDLYTTVAELFVEFMWIAAGYTLIVLEDEGVLLSGDRNLTGRHRLLGGTVELNQDGTLNKFTPNTANSYFFTLIANVLDKTKIQIMTRILQQLAPIGFSAEVSDIG